METVNPEMLSGLIGRLLTALRHDKGNDVIRVALNGMNAARAALARKDGHSDIDAWRHVMTARAYVAACDGRYEYARALREERDRVCAEWFLGHATFDVMKLRARRGEEVKPAKPATISKDDGGAASVALFVAACVASLTLGALFGACVIGG